MTTTSQAPITSRIRVVGAHAFAAVAYLAFLGVSGYAVAFTADVWVPRTIDGGGPRSGSTAAAVIDALLLTLFAVQHSVMARPAFKRVWTRLVPGHLERLVYVLAASAVLALTFWQWRPLPAVVWDLPSLPVRIALWTLYGLGWVLVVAMTFAIDHLDLLGLRQVADHVRGRQPDAPGFRLPLAYRLARHPMMTGFAIAFLATPRMTIGHLLFAALSCGYIAVAVRLEERDLTDQLPEYADYAARTPRFIPCAPRSWPASRRSGSGRSGLGRAGRARCR